MPVNSYSRYIVGLNLEYTVALRFVAHHVDVFEGINDRVELNWSRLVHVVSVKNIRQIPRDGLCRFWISTRINIILEYSCSTQDSKSERHSCGV